MIVPDSRGSKYISFQFRCVDEGLFLHDHRVYNAFGGLIPVPELLKLMALQVMTKTLYEIVALPLTIRVVRWVKRREGTDVYDNDISYNPLNIFQL